jgi:hypothetical protein
MSNRQLINARIKWSEASGRNKDMLDNVRNLIKVASDQGFELSPEERNFVSFAYKNIVSELRQQWRTLVQTELKWLDPSDEDLNGQKRSKDDGALSTTARSSRQPSARSYRSNSSDEEVDYFDIDEETMIKQKWDPRSNQQLRKDHFQEYLKSIETKLFAVCAELEETINETLLPSTGENQGKVFFRKMLADYSRYLSEILDGQERKERAEKALMSYKLAATLADSVLSPVDPVRLGLSLNFSVFYWEILGFKDRARQVAKAAFDDAMAELESQVERDYHESTLILELIRENLDLWKRHDGDLVYLGGGNPEDSGFGSGSVGAKGVRPGRGGGVGGGNHTLRKSRK